MSPLRTGAERNSLLAVLPGPEYACLIASAQVVQLRLGQQLASPEQGFARVYFPRQAVVSMLVLMDEAKTVETALIGNEGMVGLEVFLGDGIPSDLMLVQVGGEAVGVSASTFVALAAGSLAWQEMLQRYSVALMNQIARTAGCNRMHDVRQRCARWLLMTLDRVGRDEFPMTHEFLASMLGIRRASVSGVAESLQRCELIQYRQGRIRILDRVGLEGEACEDYRLSKAPYDQIRS
jgi:CRP-like cAMP-binding protein